MEKEINSELTKVEQGKIEEKIKEAKIKEKTNKVKTWEHENWLARSYGGCNNGEQQVIKRAYKYILEKYDIDLEWESFCRSMTIFSGSYDIK